MGTFKNAGSKKRTSNVGGSRHMSVSFAIPIGLAGNCSIGFIGEGVKNNEEYYIMILSSSEVKYVK